MLARLGGGDDLLRVTGMRRGEHHGVHFRVGEHFLVRIGERDSLFARIGFGLRGIADHARDEADLAALALRAVDEILSPAAQADDGCVDHCLKPVKSIDRQDLQNISKTR
ncbi:hypothetical protein D3C83_00110 [compost metagenome]